MLAGKSNDEMQQYFRDIPVEAVSDLRFMPEIPFRYYMLGFRDCVMSGGFEPCKNSDAASCFLHLVTEKLEVARVSAGLDSHSHGHIALLEFPVKLFGLLAMHQVPFAQFTCVHVTQAIC